MKRLSFEDNYAYRIRVFILSIVLIVAVVLLAFPRFQADRSVVSVSTFEEYMEELNIPETRHFEPPPPPPRPSIPIESDQGDFAEDITIDETLLDEYETWEVPPLPEDDQSRRIKFIPYYEPPEPIGGYAAIGEKLVYPPLAMEAGIEGKVILQVFVNEKGFVEDVVVQKGLPRTGFDEAAVSAVRQVRFKPARQRDNAVAVWITIIIHFRLTADNIHS